MGVLTAQIVAARGELVGALMVDPDDEVFAITSSGGVIRTAAAEVKQSGRQTMGVRLMNLAAGDSLVAIARNAESPHVAATVDAVGDEPAEDPADVSDDPADVSDDPADVSDDPADPGDGGPEATK
jgi:DNA gyrase subunit A